MAHWCRPWILLLAIALFAAACGKADRTPWTPKPHYARYGDKPVRFLIMDAFILSSPFTGLTALVLWYDDDWRTRPRRWYVRGRYKPIIRKMLLRRLIAGCLFAAMAATGLVILLLHEMDMLR